jgi:hypothetical protein
MYKELKRMWKETVMVEFKICRQIVVTGSEIRAIKHVVKELPVAVF